MHTFLDGQGRQWPVSVHVAAIKAVRGRLNLDLFKLLGDEANGLAELLADPCQLVDVLYVLCAEEADRRGVSDIDFGRAMAGDALEGAAYALVEELIDFFPNARQRATMQALYRKLRQTVEEKANALAEIDLDQLVQRSLAQSGKRPDNSGWTPAPSPSANS